MATTTTTSMTTTTTTTILIITTIHRVTWPKRSVHQKLIVEHSSLWKARQRTTERHMPYEITQCYLLSDTGDRAHLNPSQSGRYTIYLPRRDERLSWSWCLPVCRVTHPSSKRSITTRPKFEPKTSWWQVQYPTITCTSQSHIRVTMNATTTLFKVHVDKWCIHTSRKFFLSNLSETEAFK